MKKVYLSAALSVLCFATLGTCVTATAASRSGSPSVSSYALSAAPVSVTDGRSLPMLQAILGQWTSNSGRMRNSSSPTQIVQAGQAYRTVRAEQTARMQTPLNWLNAMTLKLTANRQVLTELLDMTGRDLSSESMDEKDRSQPQE